MVLVRIKLCGHNGVQLPLTFWPGRLFGLIATPAFNPVKLPVLPPSIECRLNSVFSARLTSAPGPDVQPGEPGAERWRPELVIIENAGRFRRAAGDLGQQAGKGVRRLGGRCVGVGGAMVRQLFQVRTCAFRDTNRKVHGMEAVNAHEQHMLDFVRRRQSRTSHEKPARRPVASAVPVKTRAKFSFSASKAM